MAKDEIRKKGAVTEYRPDDDSISGGKDKSVQTEARGAEGLSNLGASSASGGGAAGQIESIAGPSEGSNRGRSKR